MLNNLHDPTSPYIVGQAGRSLTLPLLPLTALTIGQLDLLPLQEVVSIRTRQRTVADKDGLENPLQLMTGRFDLAFVIIYLLPLLVLALTYNLISLEREQGTLGLLRSQPVSLGRLMLMRGALRTGLLALICLLSAAVTGLADADRLAMWMLAVALYAAFWLALALAVNSLSLGSATNAVLLTVAWLAAVAILPAGLEIAVASLRPAPSRLELLAAVRDRSIDQRRDGKQLLAEWYAAHPEMMPAGQTAPVYDTPTAGTMTHIEQDRRTLPLEAQFEAAVAARQDLVSALRFVSPAILISEALQDAAGSGLHRHRHYKAQLQAFRETWLGWFHPRIFKRTVLRGDDYGAMPQFRYQPEPTADWVGRAAGSLAALALLAASLFALALRRI